LVRGDRDVNETKLKNAVGALFVELADASLVQEVTGAPVGFAGPVGLKNVRILADLEVPRVVNAVVGGNKADVHLINVNYGRDYQAGEVLDLRNAAAGDPCPRCGAPLQLTRGIEVGHIFKLGTKYSEALGATYLGEDGQEHYIIMGSYGIGIPRTMAAAVEQNHDADGIIWPFPIAPYHVIIVPVNYAVPEQQELAESLYRELTAAGVETIIDDRDERAGVKFKDADLMGFPLRITVGPRALKEGKVELRRRADGSVMLLERSEVVAKVKAEIQAGYPKLEDENTGADIGVLG
jgi:prolyl-tRNA synthetase